MATKCRRRPRREGGAADASLCRRYPHYSDNRADGHVVPINTDATHPPLVTPERLAEFMAVLEASMAQRAAEVRP
jgi:hypothetical protein